MLTAWRLLKTKHLAHAFDGEGARRHGGRWNSPGVPVVYVAESLSLATLEILVHVHDGAFLRTYVAIRVTFDRKLVRVLEPSELPRDWMAVPLSTGARSMGDAWVSSGASAILRVPSAIVPGEHNYLINPSHPDVRHVRRDRAIPYRMDSRLLRTPKPPP
jgi:RES domain-containing protein